MEHTRTLKALTNPTLRPNQNIFLLVNIPVDETKPASMFWMATLLSSDQGS